MVGTQPNRRAMRVYPMAGLLVLAVVLVVLASGQSTRAQTGVDVVDWTRATSNAAPTLSLTPGTIVNVGDYKCAHWTEGSPQPILIYGVRYLFYGICITRTDDSANTQMHFDPDSSLLSRKHLQALTWATTGGTTIARDNRSRWNRPGKSGNYGLDLLASTNPTESTDLGFATQYVSFRSPTPGTPRPAARAPYAVRRVTHGQAAQSDGPRRTSSAYHWPIFRHWQRVRPARSVSPDMKNTSLRRYSRRTPLWRWRPLETAGTPL